MTPYCERKLKWQSSVILHIRGKAFPMSNLCKKIFNERKKHMNTQGKNLPHVLSVQKDFQWKEEAYEHTGENLSHVLSVQKDFQMIGRSIWTHILGSAKSINDELFISCYICVACVRNDKLMRLFEKKVISTYSFSIVWLSHTSMFAIDCNCLENILWNIVQNL